MQQISRSPLKRPFISRTGDNWVSSNLNQQPKPVTVVRDSVPQFRILIVDRDSMGSDLLADALNRGGNIKAATIRPANLLHLLATDKVDLVVIGAELNSKSATGFELAQQVNCTHPEIYIVILLDQTSQESVVNAFRSGARGVFSRQQPLAEFLDCVEHARKGFIWAGRDETNSLLEAFKNIPSPNLVVSPDSPQLTARELQVIQYAAKGQSNKNIARELRLSEHTVKNYLFRAFDKLGVSNRVELLFYLALRGHTFAPGEKGAQAKEHLNGEA